MKHLAMIYVGDNGDITELLNTHRGGNSDMKMKAANYTLIRPSKPQLLNSVKKLFNDSDYAGAIMILPPVLTAQEAAQPAGVVC